MLFLVVVSLLERDKGGPMNETGCLEISRKEERIIREEMKKSFEDSSQESCHEYVDKT